MNIRSSLKAFHPEEPMSCLSKNRSDIVVILRGVDDNQVWAIHNMTNSKLDFSFYEDLGKTITSASPFKDVLSEINYYNNKIELNPYSVYWLTQTDD